MRPRGRGAEQAARRFLERQGLCFVAGNVHSRVGELDLVMRDADELVIVEVRSRGPGSVVDAATTVTAHKQRRIVNATRQWLSRHPRWFEHPLRFDVVALDGEDLRWIRNAFDGA